MKKALAILLTLIFTFSCFSVLGTGTALAETQKVGQAILESDFNDADGTNWQATQQNVTYGDDNGDGVNDYASVKVGAKNSAGLVSSPFNLIPGNEYELTYYIRVPEGSESFKIGDIFYAPTTALYQPKVNSTGTKVSSIPAVSTEEASNNYYSYSYTDDADATKSWARRKGFTSTWTIDGYEPTVKSNFSNFDYRDYKAVLSATNTDINAAFANWTKVTVNFTAMAAVEGETSQVTALGFTFHDFKSDKNFAFDLKDVKLVCTNNGTETKTIMQSDFNDADGTNWQNTQNSVTYGDDSGDGVNDYARVTHTASAGKGLFSTPFNLVPGNDYELTYYIRVPEESDSFNLSGTFFAPTIVFYQPKVNDTGTKVSNVPAVDTDEAKNNYYAYSYTDDADATKSWARRKGFAATWTIDGYAARNTTNFSNFDYRDYKAVLGATNADINAAFANWTKVTVNFTAVANTEDEKSQVAAVGFVFQYYTGDKNLVFDIKDVELMETKPKEPEVPEEIVIPDTIPTYPPIPAEPTAPARTITTSVSGENCHTFVTKESAAEGEKVSVSASPFIGYKFIGWYEADELVTTEKHFTFNASVNRTLEARVELVTEENKQIFISPDVDYNGVTNLEDVTNTAKIFAGWDVENVNKARTDVNGDGKTNLKDLVILAQYVADWNVKDKLATKEAYLLPEEDLTTPNLGEIVRNGESEYFSKSTIINEGNRALFAKLFEKAEKGETITVASIGGSITQGVKDDNGQDRSYGQLVSEWIADKFGVEVKNVNAGIGSTGSLIGVHRLETDVLSHNPDLVILEYSVNDMSSRDKFAYLETYEAIIRRVLEKDIALMTAVFGATDTQYYTDYLSLHIHSALHYDLPVIDYYSSLFRYLDSGVIKWYDEENKEEGGITRDNLHPNFAGHVMISSAMNYYLDDVFGKYKTGKIYETAIDLPEETLFENTNLYNTATFYASDNTYGYQVVEPIFNYNDAFVAGKVTGSSKLGRGWICSSGKGVIIFEFKDITSLTLSMMNSKTSTGKYSIEINGETIKSNVPTETANDALWPKFVRAFENPIDVVIKITCHEGTVGVGPIGVTY